MRVRKEDFHLCMAFDAVPYRDVVAHFGDAEAGRLAGLGKYAQDRADAMRAMAGRGQRTAPKASKAKPKASKAKPKTNLPAKYRGMSDRELAREAMRQARELAAQHGMALPGGPASRPSGGYDRQRMDAVMGLSDPTLGARREGARVTLGTEPAPQPKHDKASMSEAMGLPSPDAGKAVRRGCKVVFNPPTH